MVSSHGGLKTDQTCLIKTSLPRSDQGVVYFGCWLVRVLCLDERSLITYLKNQIKQRRRRVLDHRASCVRGGCYLVQVPVCVGRLVENCSGLPLVGIGLVSLFIIIGTTTNVCLLDTRLYISLWDYCTVGSP